MVLKSVKPGYCSKTMDNFVVTICFYYKIACVQAKKKSTVSVGCLNCIYKLERRTRISWLKGREKANGSYPENWLRQQIRCVQYHSCTFFCDYMHTNIHTYSQTAYHSSNIKDNTSKLQIFSLYLARNWIWIWTLCSVEIWTNQG